MDSMIQLKSLKLFRKAFAWNHRIPKRPNSTPQCLRLAWLTASTGSPNLHPDIPDPSLVDARNSPEDFKPEFAVVYRNFLTEQEGNLLAEEILDRMKRCVGKGGRM